jgi:hypothetical protein
MSNVPAERLETGRGSVRLDHDFGVGEFGQANAGMRKSGPAPRSLPQIPGRSVVMGSVALRHFDVVDSKYFDRLLG